MTGEVVTLKEYFERILEERDKAVTAALSAAKEAVLIAEASSEKWRANANEWRGAMSDKDSKFLTRAEFTAFKEAVDKDIKSLNSFKDALQGMASQKDVNNARLIGWIGLAVGVVSLVLRFLGK